MIISSKGDLEKDIDSHNERRKRSQRINEYANSVSAMNSATSLHSFTFENSGRSNYGNDENPTTIDNAEELKNRYYYYYKFIHYCLESS